jgi:hypothetical protein
MIEAIKSRLGERSAALYARITDLVTLAADARDSLARTALARVGLATLRGEYHDYRAGQALPKGDLVTALRMVKCTAPEVELGVVELLDAVVRGEYADGPEEAARLVEGVAPARPGRAKPGRHVHEPIELTPREWRVFAWLYRYIEVYGLAPLMRELASGLETTTLAVGDILRALERKGAVAHVGGHRGWLPVRSP